LKLNLLGLAENLDRRQVCRRSLALKRRFADFGFPGRLALVPTTRLRNEDRRRDQNETARVAARNRASWRGVRTVAVALSIPLLFVPASVAESRLKPPVSTRFARVLFRPQPGVGKSRGSHRGHGSLLRRYLPACQALKKRVSRGCAIGSWLESLTRFSAAAYVQAFDS